MHAETTQPSATDPLGGLEDKADKSKGYLRSDFFSFYQHSKPAVVLAMLEMCVCGLLKVNVLSAHQCTPEACKAALQAMSAASVQTS